MRESPTRFAALIGDGVEISSELFGVDGRRCREDLCNRVGGHEAETPEWGEFTDGDAVASDDEGLAFVERRELIDREPALRA